MSVVTGNSFGARGTLSSFRPASCGRRLPFAGVHVFAGPNQVFPSVLAPARAGQDVVEAAFLGAQHAPRVLTAVAVTLANGAGAQLRALLWHLGVIHRHDHSGHTNRTADGLHRDRES